MRVPWMWEGVREKAALERALPKAHRWQKTRDEKNSKMHNFYIHCQNECYEWCRWHALFLRRVWWKILRARAHEEAPLQSYWHQAPRVQVPKNFWKVQTIILIATYNRWKCGAIFASYGGRMKHERAQVSKSLYFELELLRLDVVNVLIIILSHSVITSFKNVLRLQHSENPYKLDCDICGRPFRWNSNSWSS